jgi:uncharacterized cupredoxin-like copper-binding protein
MWRGGCRAAASTNLQNIKNKNKKIKIVNTILSNI